MNEAVHAQNRRVETLSGVSALNVVVELGARPSFLSFLPGEEGTYHGTVSLSLRGGRTRGRDLQNVPKHIELGLTEH